MEEFIAVLFEDEMWMGLVNFKADYPGKESEETEEIRMHLAFQANHFEMIRGLLSSLFQEHSVVSLLSRPRCNE